jgi:hypothetical protein
MIIPDITRNDLEDIPYSLPTRPAQRDIFWNSLVNNHVSAYFCGYAHLYVQGELQGVQKIVTGNGGAPMQGFDPARSDPVLKLEYPLEKIEQKDQKVGYIVITVNETAGTWMGVMSKSEPGQQVTGSRFLPEMGHKGNSDHSIRLQG